MHDDEFRGYRQCRYGREITKNVVGKFLVEVRAYSEDGRRDGHQRVTIRGGFGSYCGTDGCTCPETVVYHELLPEALAELLGCNPRRKVGCAARGEWHNYSHRPGWIFLSMSRSAMLAD